MPKKNSTGAIWPIAAGNVGIHTFPKGICPKVNVIAQLEFELNYKEVVVQHVIHCTKTTPALITLYSPM